MATFTLDTNCFIAIAESRPEAPHVQALVDAGATGKHNVALLASSASERQLGGAHLENFNEFQVRMENMGLGHLKMIAPIARWGLSFYGFGIMPTEEQAAREELIFRTLFPTVSSSWQDYAQQQGIDPNDLQQPGAWKWRNRLCDAQAYWSHENEGHDIFVTSDPNFRKKLVGHGEFPTAVVMTPHDAAATI